MIVTPSMGACMYVKHKNMSPQFMVWQFMLRICYSTRSSRFYSHRAVCALDTF